jgi:hypothetical protein
MATALEANLAVLAALASLGFGWILAALGLISSRRLESKKLLWVSIGFFLLGLQGGYFFYRVAQETATASDLLVPAFIGLAALITLYYAVYRRD